MIRYTEACRCGAILKGIASAHFAEVVRALREDFRGHHRKPGCSPCTLREARRAIRANEAREAAKGGAA